MSREAGNEIGFWNVVVISQTNLGVPGEESRVGTNGVTKALPVLENFCGTVSAEPTVLPWASEDAVKPKISFPSTT